MPERLLALAEREGVAGLLEYAGVFPPGDPQRIRLAASSSMRAENLLREMRTVADRARALNVPVLFFRGPFFAARYYGNPAARRSSDLDLLIHQTDWPILHDAFIAEGFRPRFTLDAPRRRIFTRYQPAMLYSHPARHVQLDVHWRLHDPPWEWRQDPWRDAVTVERAGVTATTLAPTDDAILAVAHGFRHGWSQLIHVWDMAAVLATLNDEGFDRLARTAVDSGRGSALAAAIEMVRILAGWELPEHASAIQEALAPWRDSARAACARVISSARQIPRTADEMRRWSKDDRARVVSWPLLSWRGRIRIAGRRFIHPSGLDIEAVRLPERLASLYRVVRVVRLLGRTSRPASSQDVRRLSRGDTLELAQALLVRGGATLLPVRGASMFPFIRSGDVIRVEALREFPRPGAVVLARLPRDRAVVHRVVRCDPSRRRLLLRGDACLKNDGWVGEGEILGRVTQRIRRGHVHALTAKDLGVVCWRWLWPFSNLAAALYRRYGWRLVPSRGGAQTTCQAAL